MSYLELHPMRAVDFDYINATEDEWQDPNYVYEEKYDGERQLIHIMNDGIYMTGRRVSTVTGKLPEKGAYVPQLTDFDIPELYGTVLDGELIHPDGNFDLLRSIMGSGTAERAIKLQVENGFLRYVAFDILYYKGVNVMKLPFRQRRKYLEKAYMDYKAYAGSYLQIAIQYTPELWDIKLLFQDIIDRGGEGLMRKSLDGIYKLCDGSKRSSDIQKLKKILTLDGVVIGYEYGKGKYNKNKIAKLVMGQYKDGELVERASFDGFTQEMIEDITQNPNKYIGRVVEIKCNEILKSGKLRHPKFFRWRDDKDPKQCTWDYNTIRVK